MAIVKRILGQYNNNISRASSFLSSSRSGGAYRNMNQPERIIRLSETDVLAFNNEMNQLLRQIGDRKTVERIVNQAAEIVRDRAKQLAPVAKPRKRDRTLSRNYPPKKLKPNVLYFYNTDKINKSKRAKKGNGIIRYAFGLGNIKHSIQVISKEKGYKAPIGLVGPMFTKKKKVVNPTDKRFNGWYAHMIFGSAKAFGDKVTIAALRQTRSAAAAVIRTGVNTYINRFKSQSKKIA